MKSNSSILFFVIAGSLAGRAEIPAGWSTNYAASLAAAESAQQPALLFFTASWCGPCKLMSRLTLTDPTVSQMVAGINHVAMDIDEHPDLASKHRVSAVPTFILISNSKNELVRTTGFQPIGDFMHWLTNSISEAKAAMARQAQAKKNLAEVDQLLASNETNSIHLATAKLFDLADERETAVVEAAVVRLKSIASREPAALLDGLDDPRLATRIQIANVLHAKIGESFDVDPWSDRATRAMKILAWRKELTMSH